MLNQKINYVGRKATVFNTKFEKINDKTFTVIGQYLNERGGLLFELNTSHPNSKKHEPLCIKESECKIL